MVHWSLLIGAFLAGVFAGIFFIAIATAGRSHDDENR